MAVLRRLIAAGLAACAVVPASSASFQAAGSLRIAAASDLQSVFPALAERFERESGHPVQLTFGSSGNFFAQIQSGAPFDLFFSADVDYPRRLEAAGLAVAGSLYHYATGRIVLWSRTDSGIDVEQGLRALLAPAVHRIAVANPAHAPYGRAAIDALRHEQLYDEVRDKLVFGENISQAAQFVQSGNAEVGIVALSLARAPALRAAGAYYEIPTSLYPPIDQAAVIVKGSPAQDEARTFLEFLKRSDVVQQMSDFGFAPPGGD